MKRSCFGQGTRGRSTLVAKFRDTEEPNGTILDRMIDVVVLIRNDDLFDRSMRIVRTFVVGQTVFDLVVHIVRGSRVRIGLGFQRVRER